MCHTDRSIELFNSQDYTKMFLLMKPFYSLDLGSAEIVEPSCNYTVMDMYCFKRNVL